MEAGEDNPTTSTLDSLPMVTLEYSVSTLSGTTDEIVLEFKKNQADTYIDSGVELTETEGSVELSETNYEALDLAVNDTLYYRFVSTRGTMTDQAESYVAVIPKAFETSGTATLSADPAQNQLNLETGGISASEDPSGEIRFLEPRGFEVVNDADLQFVRVSDEYYEDADVLSARQAFEEGTPVTSATNLDSGDTFVYRVTRMYENDEGEQESRTLYGVFQVENVTVVNGTEVSFDLNFAEGR